jgi:hypothetical protein
MDFEIPENLDGLGRDEIAALVAKAYEESAAFDKIADEDFTPENLEELEKLANLIETGNATVAKIDAEAQKNADRLANARKAVAKPEPTPEPDPEPEPEPAPVEDEEKVPVTAAAKRKQVTQRLARTTPAPELPERPQATIIASADVPGFGTGAIMGDLDAVAEGFIARFGAMPPGKVGNMQNRYGVATIKKARTDGLVLEGGQFRSLQDLLQEASRESRLPGGSLTAAGGWCAPSETVYDLCTIESTDGLWDVPSVNATRGGLNFTKGPDFSDFYAYAATAFQTEAEAEAGTTKVCIDVECPPFTDVRMDVAYACIRAGILTNSAYPELIRRYVEGVLIAQQHAMTARLISQAETVTGAAISLTDVWANVIGFLAMLELVAEGERQRFRMARSATLEIILPFWTRAAIRADLSNRTGVELTNVTDQMIDAHFATRGLRVQFIYNYQELDVTTAGVATDYPDTVETIMYPAGTFVNLTKDVISLEAIYDSTGLETNTYTAMFAEEGMALANVCHDPRRLSIPFQVTGLTAAAIINQDLGEAPPAYTEN